jgi:hypothetical protein
MLQDITGSGGGVSVCAARRLPVVAGGGVPWAGVAAVVAAAVTPEPDL